MYKRQDGTITFEAKKDSSDKIGNGKTFVDGDSVTIDYSFWINNKKETNDGKMCIRDRDFRDWVQFGKMYEKRKK